MRQLGFIGLGIMGAPMAAHLVKADLDHSALVRGLEIMAKHTVA